MRQALPYKNTSIAALLLAPLLLIAAPAQQADACSPPPPGYMFNGEPELPAMPFSQVAIPVVVSWYYLDSPSDDVFRFEVIGPDGAQVPGSIEVVQLDSRTSAFSTNSALVIWRPDQQMTSGEFKVTATILPTPNTPSREQTLSFAITISRGAPSREIAPPELKATLSATAIGAAPTCCPIPERSKGVFVGECFDQTSYDVQEPLGARVHCGMMEGEACELCWPTRYDGSPTLDASWVPAVDGIPAALTYYKIELKASDGQPSTFAAYGQGATERQFGVDSLAPKYCITLSAVSMVDDQSVSVERCVDRADMIPLPADPGAVKGTDRRMECVSPPMEPDMGGGADMGADMREDNIDFPPADNTSAEGDGCGCAAQGGQAPVAPAAMLAAFGLVGWLRRRRR
jgi:uncharacterized protein (TIGR03382 family)